MKKCKKMLFLFAALILFTGCGDSSDTGKSISNGNTVEKVITDQMAEAEQKEETEQTVEEAAEDGESIKENNAEETSVLESVEENIGTAVDYDLTVMSSDMVYAMVYQMMTDPFQYVGKTFRIRGTYYGMYYERTEQYYHYCIIQDATACCAQGMEFVWEDGSHSYPDEYPAENEAVIVEGTFETYTEDGDSNLYCRLANASLKVN